MQYEELRYTQPTADLVDDERCNKLRLEMKGAAERNAAAYNEARNKHREMVAEARKIWGERGAVYNYLRRAEVPAPPNLLKQWDKLMGRVQEYIRLQEERERSKDYRSRKQQTIDELIKAGYVPGDDFQPSSAITFAQKLRGKSGPIPPKPILIIQGL